MSHDSRSARRGRPTRAIHRATAPDATHAARHWVIGPNADLDGFLCQVAAICEASGPGGGPPDILWLREIAKVYGLVPVEDRGLGTGDSG
jgi:hypothetical protein